MFQPEDVYRKNIMNKILVLIEEKLFCVKLETEDFVKESKHRYWKNEWKKFLPISCTEKNKCIFLDKEHYTVLRTNEGIFLLKTSVEMKINCDLRASRVDSDIVRLHEKSRYHPKKRSQRNKEKLPVRTFNHK